MHSSDGGTTSPGPAAAHGSPSHGSSARGSSLLSTTVGQAQAAPGAYCIVRSDPPKLFLAEDAAVISRLIALKVVAAEDPATFSATALDAVHDALLEERWADAVLVWMTATDIDIDVFPEFVPVWTEADLNDDVTSMEIRMARVFDSDPHA